MPSMSNSDNDGGSSSTVRTNSNNRKGLKMIFLALSGVILLLSKGIYKLFIKFNYVECRRLLI